jgi:hypothetical protein
MVNFNQDEPGLFFKARDGSLLKVGPTAVGPTAPNSQPAGQSGNSLGETWLDNSDPLNQVFKVYDGSQWVGIQAGGGSGTKGDKGDKGEKGDLGVKGDKGDSGTKGDLGDKGDKGDKGNTASVVTSDLPPSLPVDGDLWWNSAVGDLYVWYDDGVSSQWVETNFSGASGSPGAKGDKGEPGTIAGSNTQVTYNNAGVSAGTSFLTIGGSTVGVGASLVPSSDNLYNLGSSSFRFANLYTGDINLSNEGSSNDVDGTWGSYTVQEGEDDLFIINRRTGRRFKFVLQEV